MGAIIVFVCALAVLASCVLLIRDEDYDDGDVGRLSLAALGTAAGLRVLEFFVLGWEMHVSSIGIITWIGLGLFMPRTLYRFFSWKYQGKFAWKRKEEKNV